MIANPVILGKLMHEIVQNHLLNKKHFKLNEYVEEVLKLQMAIAVAEQAKNAKRFNRAGVSKSLRRDGGGNDRLASGAGLCRIGRPRRYSDLDANAHGKGAGDV
jgi:hypothetical protein